MSDKVLIMGTFDLDPGKRDEACALFIRLTSATVQEEGCEHYAFAADLTDPGRFHLSERWSDAAALEAHTATPHLAEFRAVMPTLGVRGRDIARYDGGEEVSIP